MKKNEISYIVLFLSIAGVVFTADLISKHVVFDFLRDKYQFSVSLISGYVRFTLVKNRGAVWGLFQGIEFYLLIVNLLFVPLILGAFLHAVYRGGFLVTRCTYTFTTGMSLIFGGAAGNIYDRLVFGFVRDFIDVTIPVVLYRWPVFNVADSAISIGAGFLLISMIKDYEEPEETEENTKQVGTDRAGQEK